MAVVFQASSEPGEFRPVDGRLPIYRSDGPGYALFYVPGAMCRVGLAGAGRFDAELADPPPGSAAAALRGRAIAAERRRVSLYEDPFRPECLTLYLNGGCRLMCSYCYAAPPAGPRGAARLGVEAVVAAAEWVAAGGRASGRPLVVVLHGGGEPLLDRDHAARVLDALEDVARRCDVPMWRYVATSGVMAEGTAAWLAGRADLVGLSCDGPPDIQDRQRPRRDGGATSPAVLRTARILRDAGRPIHVRATITPATVGRQAEIAAYLCRELAPQEIHFEPVYHGGRAEPGSGFQDDRAGEFVAGLLAAHDAAAGYRVPVMFSGSRLNDVHGPYCHVLRGVVNLVPGGAATACFKLCDARSVEERGLGIGRVDRASGRFVLDVARIEALRARLAALPTRCAACVNRCHCTYTCPDECRLDGGAAGAGFRCRVQKGLSLAVLHDVGKCLGEGEGVHDLAGL